METSFGVQEKVIFNCAICNFKTESERGLKVHTKRKHDTLSDEAFPKTCDFCDEKCNSKMNLERHLKEHSYKTLRYKCEHCDFLFNDMMSLDVHVGRKHSGNFECGICGFEAKSEENLNIHLHTCETFTCDFCNSSDPDITVRNLSDLMSHLKSKHPKHFKSTCIVHKKMDRNDNDRVSQQTESSSFLTKDIN